MKAQINVGNEMDKIPVAIQAIARAIVDIFESAERNDIEQVTIQKALQTLAETAQISGITIQNCVLSGDKVVNMDEPNKDADIKPKVPSYENNDGFDD